MSFHTVRSPAFTQTVVETMRSLYPEQLADRSWDNVGLLLENLSAAEPAKDPTKTKVLLTNDLTIRVAEEAIRKNVGIIVAYHPFIFRGIKSVTLNDPQQRILIQLVQHNIAVYSPHTALDAAPGGINDWLADMLEGHNVSTKRSVVKPISGSIPEGFDGSGYGRLVEFGHSVNLGRIIEAFAFGLGGLRHVMVARPKRDVNAEDMMAVRSVGICAGSGGDVLKDCKADVLVTGEMTHHSALRATMMGQCVIAVLHSNSERQFLRKKLQPQLQEALGKKNKDVEVIVSEEDEDPFEIWDVHKLPSWAYDR